MRLRAPLTIAGLAALVTACGPAAATPSGAPAFGSPAATATPAATPSPTPAPSPSATTATRPAALVIPEMHVSMTLPAGLSAVSYSVLQANPTNDTDYNGFTFTNVAIVAISTPAFDAAARMPVNQPQCHAGNEAVIVLISSPRLMDLTGPHGKLIDANSALLGGGKALLVGAGPDGCGLSGAAPSVSHDLELFQQMLKTAHTV